MAVGFQFALTGSAAFKILWRQNLMGSVCQSKARHQGVWDAEREKQRRGENDREKEKTYPSESTCANYAPFPKVSTTI